MYRPLIPPIAYQISFTVISGIFLGM